MILGQRQPRAMASLQPKHQLPAQRGRTQEPDTLCDRFHRWSLKTYLETLVMHMTLVLMASPAGVFALSLVENT
jgi:hypothetical protein